MRRILLFCLTIVLVHTVRAQSVQPAVVEYVTAADGKFDVSNDTLVPLVVTIQAKSFNITPQGDAQFSGLAPTIHLKLSETSVRLPPHGRRTIFYKASSDTYPAWFCIYSTFNGMPRRGTMNIAMDMPHTVYLRSREPVKKTNVLLENLHREGGELQGTVRNVGANMLRIQSLQLSLANGKHADEGGFPLLPGGTRELHVALPAGSVPTRLRAKLDGFTVEGNVP
jgi:hypothetical protein